jgi:hypothetical protein
MASQTASSVTSSAQAIAKFGRRATLKASARPIQAVGSVNWDACAVLVRTQLSGQRQRSEEGSISDRLRKALPHFSHIQELREAQPFEHRREQKEENEPHAPAQLEKLTQQIKKKNGDQHAEEHQAIGRTLPALSGNANPAKKENVFASLQSALHIAPGDRLRDAESEGLVHKAVIGSVVCAEASQ